MLHISWNIFRLFYLTREKKKKSWKNSRQFEETFHTPVARIFLLFFTDILKHHLLSRKGAREFQELPFSFEKFLFKRSRDGNYSNILNKVWENLTHLRVWKIFFYIEKICDKNYKISSIDKGNLFVIVFYPNRERGWEKVSLCFRINLWMHLKVPSIAIFYLYIF